MSEEAPILPERFQGSTYCHRLIQMAQKDAALLRGLSVEQRGDKDHILSGNGGVQLEESVGGKALLSTALFSFKIIVTIISSILREGIDEYKSNLCC